MDSAHLGLPVRGSMGFNGQSAAPIVLPSSLRRLYVEAALRYFDKLYTACLP